MAQRVIEGTDAKLKKALLDKDAELRRSQDDADRCSTLQYFRTAALATCTAALATRTAALATCTAALATCTAALATCTAALATCTAALATCTAALATCTAALATCTAALATCILQTLHGGRARAVPYNSPVMRHVPTRHTTDNGTGPRGCRRRCGAWSKGGRICTGTGLAPPTSALGLGSPLPHLHRDWARPSHICTGTGLAPPTSAPALGSPLPHLHRRAAPGTWRVAVAG
jgi:hypothetical protein